MSIPNNLVIPPEQVPGADPVIPVVPIGTIPTLSDGQRWFYATWAASQYQNVGRLLPITQPVTQDGGRDVYVSAHNYYRGIPVNMPVEAGDHVMLLSPPYTGENWMLGTVVRASSEGVQIDNITATSNEVPYDPESQITGNYWLRLSSARHEVPQVFSVEGVHPWAGYPLNSYPTIDGERFVLVTQTPRSTDRRIGRIEQVVEDNGRWLVTPDRNYVQGAPVNALPTGGRRTADQHRVMALDGRAAGQRGRLVDFDRTVISFRPDGAIDPVRASRWVLLSGDREVSGFLPRESDTPEVAALRAEALELHRKMHEALNTLVSEASWRGWAEHLDDILGQVELDLPQVEHFARVSVTYFVNSRERLSPEQQANVRRNIVGDGVEDLLRRTASIGALLSESFVLPLTKEEVEEVKGTGRMSRARVSNELASRRGYSVTLVDHSVSVGVGVR